MTGYWDGADDDAEGVGMAEGWSPGGLFGHAAVDAAEVLEEVTEGPFDDGQGGVRAKPGYGNILGAQKTIAARRERAARRASMLVVERMIDELPDLRDRIFDGYIPRLHKRLVEKVLPIYAKWNNEGMVPETPLREAVAVRLKDEAVTLLAKVYRRAYEIELRRTQTVVRLGAFEVDDWADDRARSTVAVPEQAAIDLAGRVRSVLERAKRTIHSLTAPAPEAPSEPKPENGDETP